MVKYLVLVYLLFNKLKSVYYASVLLFKINCVIALSKWLWNHEPQARGSAVNFDDVMTKFIRGQTHKKLTSICFYNNKTTKWSKNGQVNLIQNDVNIVNTFSRFLIGYFKKSIKSHWLKS